jgi:hypothetical protein
MGRVYRYARGGDAETAEVGGLPNFYFVTHMPGFPKLLLERGISWPRETEAPGGKRFAAILLSSNRNKHGSVESPWHDEIDPDLGFARYYGDNKTPDKDPAASLGNRLLLSQFELHTSPDPNRRKLAAPLLIFRSDRKGYKEFCGVGLITGARRVTQFSEKNGGLFTNYLFDIGILAVTEENESVSVQWLRDRRDPHINLDLANQSAPSTWKTWIQVGTPAIEKLRRRVTRYHVIPKVEQVPSPSSASRKVLEDVYKYYDGKKHRFEALASLACESAMKESGATYRRGWLTQSTGDGGLDFVGRVDLGEGFSRTKLVVLGQAKCEKLDQPTGGVHVARTVARLRRGWLGAYVTTSFFSPALQLEIFQDQYPVMLVNGGRLADEVTRMRRAGGFGSTEDFLNYVDSDYDAQVSARHPEEILWD